MGTVVPFRPSGEAPIAGSVRARARREALSRGGVAVVGGAWKALRYALFLALMWVRAPLRWLLAALAGVSLFGLVFVALFVSGQHEKSVLLWAAGGVGFGAFAAMWFYDSLLLRLSPQPIVLM